MALHEEERRQRNTKETAEDVTKDKAGGENRSRVQKENFEREREQKTIQMSTAVGDTRRRALYGIMKESGEDDIKNRADGEITRRVSTDNKMQKRAQKTVRRTVQMVIHKIERQRAQMLFLLIIIRTCTRYRKRRRQICKIGLLLDSLQCLHRYCFLLLLCEGI